jgi:hypothetical protein
MATAARRLAVTVPVLLLPHTSIDDGGGATRTPVPTAISTPPAAGSRTREREAGVGRKQRRAPRPRSEKQMIELV